MKGSIRITFALAALCAASAHADTIAFNSFGSNDSFEAFHTYISGGFPGHLYTNAFEFAAQSSGFITQLTVALATAGGTNGAKLILYKDNADHLGSQMQAWTVTGLPAYTGNPFVPKVINVQNGVKLQSGSKYWLEMHALDQNSQTAWVRTTPV